MTIDWQHLLTILSSGALATVIAIWKVIYPMWLRSIKIKIGTYDCWYQRIGKDGQESLRICAYIWVEEERGEEVQILGFRWQGAEQADPTPLRIGLAPNDGSGNEYTLYLRAGYRTKRDLEWVVEENSQIVLPNGNVPGKIIVETTRGKKANCKCEASVKPPEWSEYVTFVG
jgi:hypothetical protein